MNKFTDRYKKYDTKELLIILTNSSDYQPEAVEAAEIEIASRKLNEGQINEIRAEIEDEKTEKSWKPLNLISIEEATLDTINPIQSGPIDNEKRIRTIAIGFTILCFYSFSSQYYLFHEAFSSAQNRFDLSTLITMLQLFILFFGTILFWTREKKGLYLVLFHCVFLIVSCLCITVALIIYGFSAEISFFEIFISILIYSAAIWSLAHSTVLEFFKTDIIIFKKAVLIMAVCSAVVAILAIM